jgi:Holliday junction resolvase RusA-like endonuclease
MRKLTLPWSCVIHDNHRFIPARGRKGLVASPEYRETKERAETLLSALWRGNPLRGDLTLHAFVFVPDNRRRDAGNYRKLITDAMSGICYDDDAQLVCETWERAGLDRDNPRIELALSHRDQEAA